MGEVRDGECHIDTYSRGKMEASLHNRMTDHLSPLHIPDENILPASNKSEFAIEDRIGGW